MRQNPFPSSTLRARALRDDNTMNSLLHPNPNPNLNPSSFCFSAARRTTLSNLTNWIPFRLGERRIGLSTPRKGRHPAVRSAATIDEAGFLEADIRNPAISTSYRPSKIPQPNRVVLEAQTKVCTGPEQTKPLSQEQAVVVLDTILRSARGELKNEEVSKAQLGAFFAAMTIRANAFPEATQWSEGERHAMSILWPRLVQVLPQDVIFIADPEGTIMGPCSSIGPHFVGHGAAEMRLVGALREVLAGGHLGYEEVQGVLRDVLPLNPEDDTSVKVSESLLAAFLIGQRMNREIDRELKAYCLAFDDELGSPPIADVRSLTHYGEPYDGNTRFLRSTLFVAAVRACYDESCLLHGVEWMPPKGGITEGQLLKFMGANTYLSPAQAKTLLEDENIGFAYVSQREACPSLYSLIGLREHIKKRPPLATSEKVQQFVRARGRESIVAGFYHEGYEDPLLMLMRRRKVHSGLVVKGEEGALSMTTKVRSVNASKGLPVNHCSGFRSPSNATNSDVDGMDLTCGGLLHNLDLLFLVLDGLSENKRISRESFSIEVNAKDYGFEPTDTPRTDRSVLRNIELGLAALGGEKGPAYDRIVLNAGMVDHLLGCSGAGDIMSALDRAREAIDSGKALNRLMNYIQASHKVT
ncbi:anthranilate phosphoribosyltransferase isoform X2 [Phoenix dactylifera]|uniref:Anthranilate phosphoribosyltransferase isoform X2 n=1 Tax=Phoenix dactylifera TaxID=42345 RepID=A0A8B7MT85_PHODC|nr:anthranilate phosphoribosyltransferase isoform X2 [Phoenix dactylifera]